MSTETLNAPAAGVATTEAKPGVRNFRNIPDIENFYRFIYENDLRRETKLVLGQIVRKLNAANKKSKRNKKNLQ